MEADTNPSRTTDQLTAQGTAEPAPGGGSQAGEAPRTRSSVAFPPKTRDPWVWFAWIPAGVGVAVAVQAFLFAWRTLVAPAEDGASIELLGKLVTLQPLRVTDLTAGEDAFGRYLASISRLQRGALAGFSTLLALLGGTLATAVMLEWRSRERVAGLERPGLAELQRVLEEKLRALEKDVGAAIAGTTTVRPAETSAADIAAHQRAIVDRAVRGLRTEIRDAARRVEGGIDQALADQRRLRSTSRLVVGAFTLMALIGAVLVALVVPARPPTDPSASEERPALTAGPGVDAGP